MSEGFARAVFGTGVGFADFAGFAADFAGFAADFAAPLAGAFAAAFSPARAEAFPLCDLPVVFATGAP